MFRSSLGLIALMTHCVLGWSIDGHLLVANMAENLLLERNPSSHQQALDMLKYLQVYDPELTYREVDHPFVECATFADDVKYHGHAWQGDYHFQNNVWLDEGGSLDDFTFTYRSKNITNGLWVITEWLSDSPDKSYQQEYMYTHLMELYPDENVAKSFALRLMIHLAGDTSQPLHNIARVDNEYPDGDKGANSFELPYHYGADELHAVWDYIIYEWHTSIARPFTQSSWDDFQPKVTDMYNNRIGGVDHETYNPMDFDAWTIQDFMIAKETCYTGVTENEVVPQSYIDKNLPIAETQIVVGAKRLETLITYVFPAKVNQEVEDLFLQ